MTISGKHQANTDISSGPDVATTGVSEAGVVSPTSRPPGRPLGHPKTGGRQKGVRNLVTREIREVAGKYTLRAVKRAWKLAEAAESEGVQLQALSLILAYGHGKPTDRQEITGADGGAITTAIEGGLNPLAEMARRFSFIMASGESATADPVRLKTTSPSSAVIEDHPVSVPDEAEEPIDPTRLPQNSRHDNAALPLDMGRTTVIRRRP